MPKKNKRGTLLLKKELVIGEVNDLLSGYVLQRYGNNKLRNFQTDKYIVRFEYKLPHGCKSTDTMVIVEIHAPSH
jgi:hypothetical protein